MRFLVMNLTGMFLPIWTWARNGWIIIGQHFQHPYCDLVTKTIPAPLNPIDWSFWSKNANMGHVWYMGAPFNILAWRQMLKERSRLLPSVFCFHTSVLFLSRAEPRKELCKVTQLNINHIWALQTVIMHRFICIEKEGRCNHRRPVWRCMLTWKQTNWTVTRELRTHDFGMLRKGHIIYSCWMMSVMLGRCWHTVITGAKCTFLHSTFHHL